MSGLNLYLNQRIKEEQYKDTSCVYNNLYNRHKFSIEEKIKTGDMKKQEQHPEHAVYGILSCDDNNRKGNDGYCEICKEDLGNHPRFPFT